MSFYCAYSEARQGKAGCVTQCKTCLLDSCKHDKGWTPQPQWGIKVCNKCHLAVDIPKRANNYA